MSHITDQYESYYFHARLMLQKRSWAMDRWYAKENRREGNLVVLLFPAGYYNQE